jgi:AMP-polyphosphate phosphotransferase
MFEAAELGRSLGQEEYDGRVPELRTALLRVQNELLRDKPCSVVVVIAGVDGAGKGDTVNTLHEWMDPRYLETHAFGALSEEERERPQMWRFWRALPPKGRIGIFFGSWYTQPIIRHVKGEMAEPEFLAELRRIQDFERMLAEDGTLVLKYWFHLSKKAQKQRLKKLSGDPSLSWRVGPDDWKHFEMYDEFVAASERALRETSTGEAPWQVIEGAQSRYRDVTCAEHLLESLAARLKEEPERARQRSQQKRPASPVARAGQPTILDAVDLSLHLDEQAYDEQLQHWQAKLNRVSRKAQRVGATMLCVFEGPDAAGKGGAIRRIARALDARFYRVISIAAPTDEEKSHHYLWRFWRHLPRAGHMVLFDRSWYGRLLVERVEGFATPADWGRAYNEISEFEEQLTERGVGLVKFWLHIDQEEQARRFAEREATSYKEFKITAEDYRNREKWPLYEDAVHDMVQRTSSSHAPWTLVAANDKRHARIEVLKETCEALERCVEATKAAKKKRKRG